jgi:DNA polymerase III epsilon subunit-like protein
MRILVFDTETTGLPQTKILNPDTLNLWPTIVQFSYVIFDLSLNEIVESKDYIIKVPKNIEISEDSAKIHGITNEISSNMGILINEALNEFFYYLRKVDNIIGHNISFDLNMIKVELLRIIYNQKLSAEQLKNYKYDLHYISNYKNIYCTLQDSIKLCNIHAIDKFGRPYLKYPKLIELHQKLFDSSPNNLHNSFNDILVTLRCFMKLKHDSDLLENSNSFKATAYDRELYVE